MVDYIDLNELSPEAFEKLENDLAEATTITVVLLPNGSMNVLSPLDRAFTRHFLLEAGIRLPGVPTN